MFYMNYDAAQPGNDYYDSILAHEFQHMIQWNVDKNEDSWFNEGMSELAAFLNATVAMGRALTGEFNEAMERITASEAAIRLHDKKVPKYVWTRTVLYCYSVWIYVLQGAVGPLREALAAFEALGLPAAHIPQQHRHHFVVDLGQAERM